jgi:hypothetical protein
MTRERFTATHTTSVQLNVKMPKPMTYEQVNAKGEPNRDKIGCKGS